MSERLPKIHASAERREKSAALMARAEMRIGILNTISKFRGEHVFNPWGQEDPMDISPCGHLARTVHLSRHFDRDAQLLLIGEAPGYAGCHFSGIPFTSERLLLDGVVPGILFFDGDRMTKRQLPWSEPSATIVWRALYALGIAERTVLWNACPWHPHRPGEPYSNRAPTPAELRAGEPILRAVLEHFSGARLVAVGNVAAAALEVAGVLGAEKVRHPANGGAPLFRQGLEVLVRRAA